MRYLATDDGSIFGFVFLPVAACPEKAKNEKYQGL
jgi:hypothetical protein